MATGIIKNRGLHTKSYTVALAPNSYVAPFSTFAETSVATDISTYGQPIGHRVQSKSTNPVSLGWSSGGGTFFVWGHLAEDVIVTVTFMGGNM